MEVDDIRNEFISCTDIIDGPAYFLNNYVTIKNPHGGSVVLEPRPYQNTMIDAMHVNNRTLMPVSRQIGTDLIVSAYSLWCALFNQNHTIVIMTENLRSSEAIRRSTFDMMYDGLPQWVKQIAHITHDNKRSVTFSNGSRIMFVKQSPQSIRGMTVNTLFLCGFDYYSDEDQREFMTSILPLITMPTNSSVHICSGVADSNGMFADKYRSIVDDMDGDDSGWTAHLFNANTTNYFLYAEKGRQELYKRTLGGEMYSFEYECGKLGAVYVNG